MKNDSSPFHPEADLDRVSLTYIRARGLRATLLTVAVASAIISTALLILIGIAWGAS